MGTVAKILDRTFLIGFFAPGVVLLALALSMLRLVDLLPAQFGTELSEPLKDTTLFVAVSFFIALFLVALNHNLFRLLEGYRPFDSYRRLVGGFQRFLYRRAQEAIKNVDAEVERLKHAEGPLTRKESEQTRKKIQRLELKAAQLRLAMIARFPKRENRILPTSFGNTIRAFEDYPQEVYGFRGVLGWTRIMACTDKEFAEQLDAAYALVSFWLNLWFAGVILTAGYVLLLFLTYRAQYRWWIATLTVLLSTISYYRARSAAAQWGTWVKAAFDLYLPKLAKTLGYAMPKTTAEQREFWETLATAIMYHDSGTLQKLDHLRDDR